MKYSILLFVIVLAACGSTPETRYYVLSSPGTVPAATAGESEGETVLGLGRISLPDYLEQAGMVMQTDDHEIRSANYHLWGEPLEQGIRRSLLRQLSADMPDFRLEAGRGSQRLLDYRLDIEVESFHGTEQGLAVLSGRWTVYSMKEHALVASERFSFDAVLPESGYQALVQTQAALLARLTGDMSSRIAFAVVDDLDNAESERLSKAEP